MSTIRPLIPLLLTAGILIGGNGLQATFIALRGVSEGFSATTIGFISAAYSLGFAVGCFIVTRILASVGCDRSIFITFYVYGDFATGVDVFSIYHWNCSCLPVCRH